MAKFTSDNQPSGVRGRPVGSKNGSTVLSRDIDDILSVLIARAKSGDVYAAAVFLTYTKADE